jgi:hypothetical protein
MRVSPIYTFFNSYDKYVIYENIYSFLEVKDIISLESTNKKIRDYLYSDTVWNSLFNRLANTVSYISFSRAENAKLIGLNKPIQFTVKEPASEDLKGLTILSNSKVYAIYLACMQQLIEQARCEAIENFSKLGDRPENRSAGYKWDTESTELAKEYENRLYTNLKQKSQELQIKLKF